MLQLRTWKHVTFNNISFEKTLVNRIELWYLQQEITYYCSLSKIMKSIYWKIIKTYNSHKL